MSDLKALEQLAADIERFKRELLVKIIERGETLFREEVPKITHRLESGVSSTADYNALTAEIIVSASSDKRGAREATLHRPDGSTRPVKLRPVNPYNYAEVVALGNKAAVLRPRKAKAFLIPVPSPPPDGEYITDGKMIYIVRRTRKGRQGNKYHERAEARLTKELPAIVSKAALEFFQ